jgi:tRNA nucleotidyltransferase (CCA-adding enzyme)
MIKNIRKKLSDTLGIPIYAVGGCIRDEILGLIPHDFDFATPIDPNGIEAAIRRINKHPYLVGRRWGAVGVKLDGILHEITTFRTETYGGSRKPNVEFVSDITADLARRDFTVNAMSIGPNGFIDPFGGRVDLENKIIRCVGNPKIRFKEDALRLLRTIRFAAQLDFSIEEKTWGKLSEMGSLLLTISKERWVMELDKILMLPNVGAGLQYLMTSRLFVYLIPELAIQYNFDQHTPYHKFSLWDHTRKVVEYSPADLNLRWAALLHDIAKPYVQIWKNADQAMYLDHEKVGREMTIKIGTYLRWSSARIRVVSDLVNNHLQDDSPLKMADNKGQEE